MSRYIVAHPAREDIRAIQQYLRERNVVASERMRERLAGAFDLIAESPSVGHTRPDLTERPVRFWTVRPYLIVYRPERQPVEILRVVHSAQDLARVLRG